MTAIPTRPDQRWLTGDLAALRRDPVGFWVTTARCAPLVRIRVGASERVVVNDADLAHRILVENRENYVKDQRMKRLLEEGTGEVLATSDGEAWQRRRARIQPAFHRSRIEKVGPIVAAETDQLLERWAGEPRVEVTEEMKGLTLRIIGRALFGDVPGDPAGLHRAYTALGASLFDRALQLVRWPSWAPTRANRALRPALATIDAAIAQALERRTGGAVPPDSPPDGPRDDLLDVLLRPHPAHGGDPSQRALRHELSALVFAGHETTATTLAWALYELARRPVVVERLRAELDGALGDRDPSVAELGRLPYLRQVVDETLRMYPALYVNSRQALADDHIGPYRVPAHTRLLVNILGIHRSPRYWSDPDTFDADRFAIERRRAHHRSAFLPFLLGPRRCVGAPLALAELQLVVARVVRRFDLGVRASAEPETRAVLQPRGGLVLDVRPAKETRCPSRRAC